MALWALVFDGVVSEVTDIDPDGRFHPDFKWYPCPEDTVSGWVMTMVDGVATFAPYVPPPLTESQIIDINTGAQNIRLQSAAQAMAPVLVSLNLGDATDEETLIAKGWQAYYRALKLVDLTVENPEWPEPPISI